MSSRREKISLTSYSIALCIWFPRLGILWGCGCVNERGGGVALPLSSGRRAGHIKRLLKSLKIPLRPTTF